MAKLSRGEVLVFLPGTYIAALVKGGCSQPELETIAADAAKFVGLNLGGNARSQFVFLEPYKGNNSDFIIVVKRLAA